MLKKAIMEEKDFIEMLQRNKADNFILQADQVNAGRFLKDLYDFLFLSKCSPCSNEMLAAELEFLKTDFDALVVNFISKQKNLKEISDEFFNALPGLYRSLIDDANVVVLFDPAAASLEEVLIAYPGFFAVATYRIAHKLVQMGIKILPRLLSEYAHSKTGIDIHPGAKIGNSFFIDHGTGIVIGETSVIGNNVKIYQGVTLGALNVSKEMASVKRHPTIQDEVIIYSGATILGGDTVIGRSSIIGGNVWLTYSVPAHSVVYHKSEVKVRDNNPFPEPLNFVI